MKSNVLENSGDRVLRDRLRFPPVGIWFATISLLVLLLAVGLGMPTSSQGVVSAAPQADPQLGFYPKDSLMGVGETYCIDVTIKDAEDLGAFEWDVTFDSSVISADDANIGSFLGSTGRDAIGLDDTRLTDPPPAPQIGPGVIGYGAFSCPLANCFSDGTASTMPGPSGNGTIASLRITGLAAGTSVLNFQNELVVGTDAMTQTIAASSNGSVQVTPSKPDDVVVIKAAGGTQTLYRYDAPPGLNTEARPLGSDTTVPKDNNVTYAIGGDFDGDGSDEIGTLKDYGSYKAFIVYDPRTACGDAAAVKAFNLDNIPKGKIDAMAAVDIDGDGTDEVATIKDFGFFRAILVNRAPTVPNGPSPLVAFQTPASARFIPGGTTGVMAGVDYNGDGTDEIAIEKRFGNARFLFIYANLNELDDRTVDLVGYQYTLMGNPPDWAGPPIAMSGVDYNGDGVDEVALVKQFGGAGGTQVLYIYQTPNGPWGAAPLLAWSMTPTTGNNVAFLVGIKP